MPEVRHPQGGESSRAFQGTEGHGDGGHGDDGRGKRPNFFNTAMDKFTGKKKVEDIDAKREKFADSLKKLQGDINKWHNDEIQKINDWNILEVNTSRSILAQRQKTETTNRRNKHMNELQTIQSNYNSAEAELGKKHQSSGPVKKYMDAVQHQLLKNEETLIDTNIFQMTAIRERQTEQWQRLAASQKRERAEHDILYTGGDIHDPVPQYTQHDNPSHSQYPERDPPSY